MREIFEKALKNKKNSADYIEIRTEKKETTTIHFQGKKLENGALFLLINLMIWKRK
jgi:predicted Zn-dependent protease